MKRLMYLAMLVTVTTGIIAGGAYATVDPGTNGRTLELECFESENLPADGISGWTLRDNITVGQTGFGAQLTHATPQPNDEYSGVRIYPALAWQGSRRSE